jgi:hypothetical protein
MLGSVVLGKSRNRDTELACCCPRYVAFLCSRLLEVSKEERAAHVIQRAWQQHKAKTAGALDRVMGCREHAAAAQGHLPTGPQGAVLVEPGSGG